MKKLVKYLSEYKKEVVLAPLFKLLEAIFELIVPLVMAKLIDEGIGGHNESMILKMGGVLALLAAVGLTAAITAQFFAARAAVGFAAKLRIALFDKIQDFSFTQLDSIGTGTLTTRMTSDINQAQNGVNMFLRLFLRSPFVVLGAMIMAFTVDARASLIFLLVIPVLAVIVVIIMAMTAPMYRSAQGKLDNALLHTRENLVGARVIRAFGKEAEEKAVFDGTISSLTGIQRFTGAISGLLNPLTQVIVDIGLIVLIARGAVHINAGTLTQGQVIALINYMSQILVELVKFANLIVTISRALASADRVASILDIPADHEEGTENPPGSEEAVVFDHVSLTYAGAGDEALHDISFTARTGETIGVIGGTGSGKSSLVNLIPRFYDATKGSVRVFGSDVKMIDTKTLRARTGVVFQKAQLFSGSVRDNLLWGNRDAGESQIKEALDNSQAAEFVYSRPEGADHMLEQGARNLSGGQKQRLSIARALIRKPDILILDDAASALDFATDLKLRTAIRKMSGSMTIFIVSQRVPSVRNADRILVLDAGHLAGTGSHEELLESCEVYREIYYSQFPEEAIS
ncbi:MAG: ABC transporter ATP-binding protein/permease [Lachnospiraceae bacterium]|nr:ABC transporter ATP-binding protein/permease [Lachnospiraceae bacterium]